MYVLDGPASFFYAKVNFLKEAIEIKEVENDKTIVFEVKVAEEDMGKIIGRQGKIAQSIRTVMRAVANRKDKKVTVEFIG